MNSANSLLKMANNNYTLVTATTSSMALSLIQKISNHKNLIIHARTEEVLNDKLPISTSNNDIKKWICDFNEVENIKPSLSNLLASNEIFIDEFVHFAGILGIGAVKNIPIQTSKKIFDVNFFSALEIIRVLISNVNKKSVKNIVLISALSSLFGDKGNSLYVASKSALDGLVRSLSLELAPQTRINSVLPGGVYTQMTAKVMEKDSRLLTNNPLGAGDVSDVTDLVEFLLSDRSRWITGQNLVIDGGRSRNIFDT